MKITNKNPLDPKLIPILEEIVLVSFEDDGCDDNYVFTSRPAINKLRTYLEKAGIEL